MYVFRVWFHLYVVQSPVRTRTPTSYLDFKLDPGATVTQPVTEGWLITYSCFNHSLAFLHIKVVLASFLVSFTQLSGFFASCHPTSFLGVDKGPLCLGTGYLSPSFQGSLHLAIQPRSQVWIRVLCAWEQGPSFQGSLHLAIQPRSQVWIRVLCRGGRTRLNFTN